MAALEHVSICLGLPPRATLPVKTWLSLSASCDDEENGGCLEFSCHKELPVYDVHLVYREASHGATRRRCFRHHRHPSRDLAKLATELYQLLQEAPSELAVCKKQIHIIDAEVDLLRQRLVSSGRVERPSPEELAIVSALTAAEVVMRCAVAECGKFACRSGVRSRVKWVFMDRGAVERLLTRLGRVETSLGVVLQLQSHKCHVDILTQIAAIRGCVEHIEKSTTKEIACIEDTRTNTMCVKRQTGLLATAGSSELHIEKLGLLASFVWATGQSGNTDYYISLRCQLPVPTYLFSRVLWLELSLRRFPLSGVLHLSAGGVALGKIVERDAPLLNACEHGDMDNVVRLLNRNQGGLIDTTSDGWTPMRVGF
ncbi:hypothetical protein BDV96DRAFT_36646 [Lophiotrema nucula]|uniref:Uncharacterized protein n=1 Tax=Lophiotrema nucula TaxID=690887 RepID=A0A6A5ZEI5_9PLEO|nr:hypothetical protein BDV96DRAFT_36646 [Lophiotrema nucula]